MFTLKYKIKVIKISYISKSRIEPLSKCICLILLEFKTTNLLTLSAENVAIENTVQPCMTCRTLRDIHHALAVVGSVIGM